MGPVTSPLCAAVLAVAAATSACVASISPTSEQVCASRGMELEGVNIHEGTAIVSGWRRSYLTDISGLEVRCGKPRDAQGRCRIDQQIKGLEPAAEFNAGVGSKNLILAAGYLAFIAPGVYLYFQYASDRETSVQRAAQLVDQGLRLCEEPNGTPKR